MLCELVVGAIYGTITTSYAGSNLWEYFGRGRPTVIRALYVCGKNSAPKAMEFAILYQMALESLPFVYRTKKKMKILVGSLKTSI